MNTNTHTGPTLPAPVSNNKDAEVRARVPQWMKDGVDVVATERLLDGADIVREAIAEYLARRKPANQSEPATEQVAA